MMKKLRFAVFGTVLAVLLTSALAQKATPHLLSSDELKKTVPAEFYFFEQKAPTQMRNSTGFQLANGKITLAALVDNSGYSSDVQQKYQGLLITESKLNISGSDLPPGQYGFGFAANKFFVMNVANEDVLSSAFQTDAELKRPVPLKMAEDSSGYKLYAGRKWIAIKPE
jgi:hypothetical protein